MHTAVQISSCARTSSTRQHVVETAMVNVPLAPVVYCQFRNRLIMIGG